jgi:hypothetical protein
MVQADYPPSKIIGDIDEHTTRSGSQKLSHFSNSAFVASFKLKDVAHTLFYSNLVNSMHEELENFKRNQVWELVDPPPIAIL